MDGHRHKQVILKITSRLRIPAGGVCSSPARTAKRVGGHRVKKGLDSICSYTHRQARQRSMFSPLHQAASKAGIKLGMSVALVFKKPGLNVPSADNEWGGGTRTFVSTHLVQKDLQHRPYFVQDFSQQFSTLFFMCKAILASLG